MPDWIMQVVNVVNALTEGPLSVTHWVSWMDWLAIGGKFTERYDSIAHLISLGLKALLSGLTY